MIVKRRYFVRKDKVADIQKQLGGFLEDYPGLWPEKAKIEVLETDKDISFIMVDKKPVFFERGGKYFPTLKAVLDISFEWKNVVVDEGAVRFVVNGADIMKPGIVEFEKSISAGDVVVVFEEKHRKSLAIGVSLLDAGDFDKKDTGKAVKNIHYVGDEIWAMFEKI
jgi:PUA domain protein